VGFWDNEGFWAAMGGGLQGTLRVGGSNASVADWLAAYGAGSGAAVDQRQESIDRERERVLEAAQAEEERRLIMEDRQLRLKASQDAAAEKMRMDAAASARDQRARDFEQNPYFVDPSPSLPEEFANPGDYSDAQARQAEAGRKQAELERERKLIEDFNRANGLMVTGDEKLDRKSAEAFVTNQGKGPDTLTPSESLAERKFQYQQSQDQIKGALEAGAAKRQPFEDWQKAYRDNLQIAKSLQPPGQATAEDIVATAKKWTEDSRGPVPPDPTAERLGTGPAGRISPSAAVAATPSFSGALPTAKATVSSPTGVTAPPKSAPSPMAKSLADIDVAINSTFNGLPTELRAQLKIKVVQAVHRGGMTLEQAMAEARRAAFGTQFISGP